MSANAPTTELSRRLAALSPDRLALLQRRLVRPLAGDGAEEIPLQPRGERRDFPLSSAQERMWFNHQLSPRHPLYNESFGLRIKGNLKVELLAASVDYMMARHEIFTITLHAAAGRLFQRLGGCLPPRLESHDLSELDQSRRAAAYEAGSQDLLRQPFQLDCGPLFRAGLWTIGEGDYRLIFVMHHIIFDGWSGSIFFRELLTTYNTLVAEGEPDLPPPGPQYIDFAVWEQTHFDEAATTLDHQLDYWKQQLAGAPAPPRLPLDHQALESLAAPAGREVFVCPAELTEALLKLAKESGATLFMALLAIFKMLLARYSGQEDILVGLPTINRNQGALGDMIGVFINTVILRTDLSGEVTYRELLARIRTTTVEAQANQEVPLERVVGALGRKGDAGRSLVNVMFDLQKKTETLVECPGLGIQSMDVGTGLTKFDLVLAMEDTGRELRGILDYASEKIEPETAQQLTRDFVALMKSAITQPDVPVNRLAMTTDNGVAELVARGKETFSGDQKWACVETITHALRGPGALALTSDDGLWTYGEMHGSACRLASYLRSRNAGHGQRVALLLPAGPDLVIAQLAVMMTGAAFVPIDVATPAARLAFLIEDCQAALVLAKSKSPDTGPVSVPIVHLDLEQEAIDRTPPLLQPASIQGSDPAYLIYTSGSTGQPKGVVVSHAALRNLVGWHHRVFALSAADRGTQLAAIGFDASIWEIWPYLAAGASLHFPPGDLIGDVLGLQAWLLRNKITISFVPTPLAEEMIELDWPSKGDLRFLLTGGDRLRKRPSRVLPFQLINNYGPTENTVVATSGAVVSNRNGGAPSIGSPIDNVWLRIVDRNLQTVPKGVPGELIVGGRSLANGYWNQPELTAESFITLADGQRAYRTGDLCRIRRDEEIEFLGRLDSQVKVRGCRIELSEIENALLAHDAIRDAVACVRQSKNGQKRIIAYVVPEDQTLPLETLRPFVADWLPAYMMPSQFVKIEQVPRTPNGKIDHASLPEPEAESTSSALHIEPRNPTELKVASLWQDLLAVGTMSVGDDFFELGGDSLLATRLAVLVREEFGVEMPLAQMLRTPTIEAIAAYVDDAQTGIRELPRGVLQLKSGRSSLAPLFLTPPASGSPACYVEFVAALADNRAVYGFEAPGLVSGPTIACFTTQARKYVEALRTVQPCGPYYLAGWSLGGPVAFEMARQLREANQEVAYLGLIDAALPEKGRLPGGMSMMRPMWWSLAYPSREGLPRNYQTFRLFARGLGIGLPESFNEIRQRGWRGGWRYVGAVLGNGWRSTKVLIANLRAMKRYQPSAFDGEVTLFQTAPRGIPRDADNALGKSVRRWARAVTVRDAPGSHLTLLLDPGTASSFAPSFAATIDSSTPNQRQ